MIEKLSYEDILAFPKELFQELYVEAVVHGNMTDAEAKSIVSKIKEKLVVKPLDKQNVKTQTYLVQSEKHLAIAKVIESNNDCLRQDFYLGKDSPKMRMASKVLNNFIEQPFYTEMRTRQQLGYIVWGGAASSPVDHFLIFLIQSGTHDVLEIQKRVNAFVPTLKESFAKLKDEEFEKLKNAIEAELKEKDKTIRNKTSRFFRAAFKESNDFDRRGENLAALKSLKKVEVQSILERALDPKTLMLQELLLFSEGKSIPEALKPKLSSLDEFRKNSKYDSKQ